MTAPLYELHHYANPYEVSRGDNLVGISWKGFDADAVRIITHNINDFQFTEQGEKLQSESVTPLKTMAQAVAPLRSNLHLVPENLREVFTRAADFQDEWLEHKRSHVILHGRPHHYNNLFTGSRWDLIDPLPILGPIEHDFAFVLNNPYDLNQDLDRNLTFMKYPARFEQQVRIISASTGLRESDLAAATLNHNFTTAAKRFWAEENMRDEQGHKKPLNIHGAINEGEVGARYFIEHAKHIAPVAGFNWN